MEHRNRGAGLDGWSLTLPRASKTRSILDRVTLHVPCGQITGLVGESGSGKSLIGRSILGFLPSGSLPHGDAYYREGDRERERVLGRELALISQDALAALNPRMKVKTQLRQVIGQDTYTVDESLAAVGLNESRIANAYPHELSGGQRQRVLIALALAQRPSVLIADEPTTALDVTLQADVMDLLTGLVGDLGLGILFISHDIGLVLKYSQYVYVLYAGQVTESGRPNDIRFQPRHWYTRGLIASALAMESREPGAYNRERLKGSISAPDDYAEGCRFAPRCPAGRAVCASQSPEVRDDSGSHRYLCHFPAASPIPDP